MTFIFVSGHIGVKRNERVNRLASAATVACGRAISEFYIVKYSRDIGLLKISGHELDSVFLARLVGQGVMRLAAKYKSHTRSNVLLMNTELKLSIAAC